MKAKVARSSAKLHLTPKDQGRPLTLSEFGSATAQLGSRYELVDGKLDVWPFPELAHECVRDWLRDNLSEYEDQRPYRINQILTVAGIFILDRPSPSILRPDLVAYHDFPHHLPIGDLDYQDVSPALVAEVLWEHVADKDLVRNVAVYLQVPSIREYWILDPRSDTRRPSMIVYCRRGHRWQKPIHITAGGTYTTPLLPGFTLVLDRHRSRA